jgi:LAO/AO transport system kinase
MDSILENLVESFKAGERLALSRAISLVEDEKLTIGDFLKEVSRESPVAGRIGITGPPGSGKSTLVSALAHSFRASGEHVGILSVDPTSPFSGGALLGDRVRMNDLSGDPGVFIRSVASRGSLGGLSGYSEDIIELMEAFGLTKIIVETVGVGQTELEVNNLVDSVVVLLVPESGDGVQMMKAGLMEIADIFTINKSDRPGADRLLGDLEMSLSLGLKNNQENPNGDFWKVPIVKTIAIVGDGIQELFGLLEKHHDFLQQSNQLETIRRERITRRIRQEVTSQMCKSIWGNLEVISLVKSSLSRIDSGEATVHSVSRAIVESFGGRTKL